MSRRPPRFFIAGLCDAGDVVDFAPDDARKLRVVLRARPGDEIEVLDSSGRAYAAELIVERDSTRAKVLAHKAQIAEPTLRLTLAQGIPRGAKMDFVVEKATELGIARLIPFTSERTQGRDAGVRTQRWRRLAEAAARQCGRADIPPLNEPLPFSALCETFGRFDVTLVPWELTDRVPLGERLPALLAGVHSALIVIGPEGGLSHDEVGLAQECGGHPISLGERILRTETAGLVACSALLYASGNL